MQGGVVRQSIGWLLLIVLLAGSRAAVVSVSPGLFQGTADFGSFSFQVNEDGTAVNKLTFTWSSWTCGPITRVSGSMTVSRGPSGWPITNDRFSIDITLYSDPFNPFVKETMTIAGAFGASGSQASGTWNADVRGVRCSGTWSAGQAQLAEQDSLALVALYQATDGPNWTDHTNWLTGPVQTWAGVERTGQRVTALGLSGNGLVGELPAELGDLTGLRVLHLHSNQLTGEIPRGLAELTYLYWLKLDANQLTGEIPSELEQLTNLTRLALNRNQLTGEIPPELGNLANLTILALAENRLTGAIPEELGYLRDLSELYVNLNQLTGGIPEALSQLPRLKVLDLNDNQLTGAIPAVLGDLDSLTVLHLGVNQLTGEIPEELGHLADLTDLSLAHNQLTGEIPSALGSLANLTELDLGGNRLTGEIPPAMGDLASLTNLSLYGNQLTGGIPVEPGHLSHLTQLALNGNPLTGTVPEALGDLTELTHLYLQYTGLSGTLPLSLTHLAALECFYFNDTDLVEPLDEGFQAWLHGVPDVQSTGYTNVAAEDAPPVPAAFVLYPSYPNPFNGGTTIRYDVPQPGLLRLAVYDLLGRRVRVLVDGEVPAGVHEVRFDADGLPSGVYAFRLDTPAGSFTRTMHLLR